MSRNYNDLKNRYIEALNQLSDLAINFDESMRIDEELIQTIQAFQFGPEHTETWARLVTASIIFEEEDPLLSDDLKWLMKTTNIMMDALVKYMVEKSRMGGEPVSTPIPVPTHPGSPSIN